MAEFKLSAEKIKKNWSLLEKVIEKYFSDNPDRYKGLMRMYGEFKEDLMFAPASSFAHFHNAIPGGYVDHILRVISFTKKVYSLYKELGFDVDDFTEAEMVFVAMNHDLGKAGFPGEGNEGFKQEKSDWHRKNQGKMYTPNKKLPFATVPHRGLYILQKYDIKISWHEYQAILIHDGIYDEGNKPYYISFKPESKLRTLLPKIIHQADMMATDFEWQRWAKAKNEINLRRIDKPVGTRAKEIESKLPKEEKEENPFNKFEEVFGE